MLKVIAQCQLRLLSQAHTNCAGGGLALASSTLQALARHPLLGLVEPSSLSLSTRRMSTWPPCGADVSGLPERDAGPASPAQVDLNRQATSSPNTHIWAAEMSHYDEFARTGKSCAPSSRKLHDAVTQMR